MCVCVFCAGALGRRRRRRGQYCNYRKNTALQSNNLCRRVDGSHCVSNNPTARSSVSTATHLLVQNPPSLGGWISYFTCFGFPQTAAASATRTEGSAYGGPLREPITRIGKTTRIESVYLSPRVNEPVNDKSISARHGVHTAWRWRASAMGRRLKHALYCVCAAVVSIVAAFAFSAYLTRCKVTVDLAASARCIWGGENKSNA